MFPRYILVYIYMIRSSAREVPPPPNGMGLQVAPPPLAAFLRSSLVFSRFLQRFWLPASHLLGTCYPLDDLRSTNTHISIYIEINKYIYIYIYMYIHTYMFTCLHVYMFTCLHTYIHTYIHTCIALHCIALHCIALHCIALHYITLHYITLHTYIHTYIHIYIYIRSTTPPTHHTTGRGT